MPPATGDAALQPQTELRHIIAYIGLPEYPTEPYLLQFTSHGPRLLIVTTLDFVIRNEAPIIHATLRLCSACSNLRDLSIIVRGTGRRSSTSDFSCSVLPRVRRLVFISHFQKDLALPLLSNVPNLEDLTLNTEGHFDDIGTESTLATWKLRRLSFLSRRPEYDCTPLVLQSSVESLRELEFYPAHVPIELMQPLILMAPNLRTVKTVTFQDESSLDFSSRLVPLLSACRRLTTLSMEYRELHALSEALAALTHSRIRHLDLRCEYASIRDYLDPGMFHLVTELSSPAFAITSLQRVTFAQYDPPSLTARRALERACQRRRIALDLHRIHDL
ncbi:hypothetical protein EXIGLDRAFT_777410 [Exidia glandulosa HHB12029]|uniref:F-box domain-containing protein n=1 Tax=Exidia glandulosa HHB12029 TaxID=1314781 RepID=A0A165D1B2_EXIGL|nr:hypothetical protein EXIGLDRAFT_777410 [Exidia glandulosa HHB12029]